MIVLVTGGRDYTGQSRLWAALDMLRREVPEGMALCIVEGGATGADAIARRWLEARRDTPGATLYAKRFHADWAMIHDCREHAHDLLGAGPCRNGRMVAWVASRRSDDKRVLACPGGIGTADCVEKARNAGLFVQTLDEALEYGRTHKCSWCGHEHSGGPERCEDGL